MAIKRFCDHCDYDVTDSRRLYQATVEITPPPATSGRGLSQKSLDLCVDCAARLRRAIDRPPAAAGGRVTEPPTKESGSEYAATEAQHTRLVTMNELLHQADDLRREVERLRRALNDCTNTDDDYVYKTAQAALERRP